MIYTHSSYINYKSHKERLEYLKFESLAPRTGHPLTRYLCNGYLLYSELETFQWYI